MTLREFNAEYQLYKNDWDYEMLLFATRTTYAQAKEQLQQQEEWF